MNEEPSVAGVREVSWLGLRNIIRQCYETARAHGWWEKYDDALNPSAPAQEFLEEIIATKLMLAVSELSETLEEVRAGKDPKEVYYTRSQKILPDGTKFPIPCEKEPGAKPEGVPIELADVVIRVFDLAEWLGIDLVSAIQEKMNYNESREYRHGGKKL